MNRHNLQRRFAVALATTLGALVNVAVAGPDSWHAGTWDASNFPFVNGHPTTVALRVEVSSAESGYAVADADVTLQGEYVDEDGLRREFRLDASTDAGGVAVIGLGWRDEVAVTALRRIEVTDDIQKARQLVVRKRGYAYEDRTLNLSVLKQDRDAWKTIVNDTPGAKYIILMTDENFRYGSKTSTTPGFFQKVRNEDYHKVLTADSFPNRQLDIPTFHERLTIGPFIVLPVRIALRPTVTESLVEPSRDNRRPVPRAVERNEEWRDEPRRPAQRQPDVVEQPRTYNPPVTTPRRTEQTPVEPPPATRDTTLGQSPTPQGQTVQSDNRKEMGLYPGTQGFALSSGWAGLPAGVVVESIDHRFVGSESDFRAQVASRKPGDQMVVGYWRRTSNGKWERNTQIVTLPR